MSKINHNREKLFSNPFSAEYWRYAVAEFSDVRMIAIAAIVVAVRVALHNVAIPILGDTLQIHFSFWINALGAMIYGPVVSLLAGAVSDTLSCIIFPSGAPYFFPFIFVEMLGSFVFALFLYRAKLTNVRIVLSRFAVIVSCNFILNPIIMYYYYQLMYENKSYTLISVSATVVKNLVMFPLEAIFLVVFLSAMIVPLKSMGLVAKSQQKLYLNKWTYVLLVVLAVIAAAAIYCYFKFDILNVVKDWVRENIVYKS